MRCDSNIIPAALIKDKRIYSTDLAFAAVLKDGTVVTWGDKDYGGNSAAVQAALTGVETIYSTWFAFAALLNDGTVVTWGQKD